MNQKSLQMVYKKFEKEEFYKRYLKQMGCRQDRRSTNQHRPMKAVFRNNSVVFSCGQTVIITHLESTIEKVTFSPKSNTYGQQLIKIKVQSGNTIKSKQTKLDKAIQEYINKKIQWQQIEEQIVQKDSLLGAEYGHKGEIVVRILGDDGCVEEYALLSCYLLLKTCKFMEFVIQKNKIISSGTFQLKMTRLLFPTKYCTILDEILVDPSQSQQASSDIQITLIKDLMNPTKNPIMIKKNQGKINFSQQNAVDKIIAQWEKYSKEVQEKFVTLSQQIVEKNQCNFQ